MEDECYRQQMQRHQGGGAPGTSEAQQRQCGWRISEGGLQAVRSESGRQIRKTYKVMVKDSGFYCKWDLIIAGM